MNKNDLPPGTKVIASVDNDEYGDHQVVKYYIMKYSDCTLNGQVIDSQASDLKAGPDQVVVAWDSNDWRAEQEVVDCDLLSLESDLPAFEKEFNTAMKAIKEKVVEASLLIKEANRMAIAAHAKNLESLYDASSPLIDVMDNSGWHSSSWDC
jgi:hypothetical protein